MPDNERLQALGNASPVQMSAWVREQLRHPYRAHYSGNGDRPMVGDHAWPNAAWFVPGKGRHEATALLSSGSSFNPVLFPFRGLSSFVAEVPVLDAEHYKARTALCAWAAAGWVHGKERLPPMANNMLVAWRVKGFKHKAASVAPTTRRSKKAKPKHNNLSLWTPDRSTPYGSIH